MLKFALAPAHTVSPWVWTGHRWVAGESWIEPFVNPALESFCLTDGASTLFAVRERGSSTATRYPRRAEPAHVPSSVYSIAVREVRDWLLEFFLVEAENDSVFRFSTGIWGTAPISVIERGGTLYGSWSWTDLRLHLSTDSLCEEAVARYLARLSSYSRFTIFRPLLQITERSSGTHSPAGLQLHYPEDALHAEPRELREEADVLSAFERLLAAAVARHNVVRGDVCVELSGGIDSANTALSVADLLGDSVPSYALMVDGHTGRQQQRRRAELVAHGKFVDRPVHAMDHAPFAPSGPRARGHFFAPHEEPYGEALHAAAGEMAARGHCVVITGVGGDELMSLCAWERPPRPAADDDKVPSFLTKRLRDLLREAAQPSAPASVVSEPSLCAGACRSPTFLRAGCWPISPLCTPELVRFCEWLPTDWRRGKRLLRTRLERRHLSFDVVYPQHRENFAHVMAFGLRTHARSLPDTMASASVLVDGGFVEGASLARWREALDDDNAKLHGLYEVVNLETSLQALG